MKTSYESVSEAFDKLEAAESGTSNAEAPGAGDAGPNLSEGVSDQGGGDASPVEDSSGLAEAGATSASDGRARGPDGKFVAKSEATETKAPTPGAKAIVKPSPVAGRDVTKIPAQAAQPGTAATPAVATPPPAPGVTTTAKFKAPQSLRPLLREKWAALPEDWQGEIDRLERDAKTGIEKNAEAAKFREQFQQVAAPYQAMLGGADPVQATRNLFQAAHTLNYAPPQQKAQLLARMIQDSGAPLELINAALEGGGATAATGQPKAMDQESIIQQVRKEFQAQQQQQEQTRIMKDIESFKAGHEFYADVEPDMVELINLSRGRGVTMTLEQAYNRAIQLHPEVSAALKQREAAQAVTATKAATARAIAASTPVKSQPSPHSNGVKPKTALEAVEAAWETLSNR